MRFYKNIMHAVVEINFGVVKPKVIRCFFAAKKQTSWRCATIDEVDRKG